MVLLPYTHLYVKHSMFRSRLTPSPRVSCRGLFHISWMLSPMTPCRENSNSLSFTVASDLSSPNSNLQLLSLRGFSKSDSRVWTGVSAFNRALTEMILVGLRMRLTVSVWVMSVGGMKDVERWGSRIEWISLMSCYDVLMSWLDFSSWAFFSSAF